MGAIQSETAYFQPNPNALQPFKAQSLYTDPIFPSGPSCSGPACYKTWGLRIVNSSNIFTSGAGLYSFFDNYDETCNIKSCQQNIVDVTDSSNVHLWGLSTKAAANMITLNGNSAVAQRQGPLNNTSNFCETIALFEVPLACPT